MPAPAFILAAAELTWTGVVFTLAALLVLLALSATFSGSETVLFSLTRVQLERCAASPNPFRRLVPAVMARPKRTLTTILVGNTAANVLLFAVSYVFFLRLSHALGAWVNAVAGAASILLVVVVGEVTPKVLAVALAERVAPAAATVVRVAGIVAGPIGAVLDLLIVRPFERVVLGRAERTAGPPHDLSTEELKALLQMSRRHGEIDQTEDAFLREVIDLGGTRVRDVMVPRVEIVAYDLNQPAQGLRELMRATHRKKIPVYDRSMDDIIGLVYAKMLFLNPDQPLRQLVVPVRFVPELATCEQVLYHFRQTRTQLAIVVDEFGGVAGLVTLEDVLEEIVGELSTPEDQPQEPEIVPLSETEYDISGALDVRYWAEVFRLPRQTERVATVGGLVTTHLGRPAQVDDHIQLGNVELRVTRVHRWRIERLHLRWQAPRPAEESVP